MMTLLNSRGRVFAVGLAGLTFASAQDSRAPLPQPVGAESFAAVRSSSPFFRSLELADSIVLTGVGRIEDEIFASLLNTETAETFLVTRVANPQGWQLVDIRGDESSLQTTVAEIQMQTGDVVSIRYEEVSASAIASARASRTGGTAGSQRTLSAEQLRDARNAAENYRDGFRGDGIRGAPPQELMQKLSRLSVTQREGIIQEVLDMRNRGVDSDDRRRVYLERVDQALQR